MLTFFVAIIAICMVIIVAPSIAKFFKDSNIFKGW